MLQCYCGTLSRCTAITISTTLNDLKVISFHRSSDDSFVSQKRGERRGAFREILGRRVFGLGALWSPIESCHRLRLQHSNCHCWHRIQGGEIWIFRLGAGRQGGSVGMDTRWSGDKRVAIPWPFDRRTWYHFLKTPLSHAARCPQIESRDTVNIPTRNEWFNNLGWVALQKWFYSCVHIRL